ncbi:MAG: hypothetical protein ACKVZJ_09560, partial [Phycisphaerales bacterium]
GTRARDAGERAWQFRQAPPQSVRVGGKWVSYARIEPFGSSLALVIDAAQRINGPEARTPLEEITGVWHSLKQMVQDKTMLQGLAQVLDILDGTDAADTGTVRYLTQFTTSWVPNIIRGTARSLDPVLREQRVRRAGDEALIASGARRISQGALPLPSRMPPPMVDVWGRDVSARNLTNPAADWAWRVFSPVRMTDAKTEPVDVMLWRWNNAARSEERWYPRPPQASFTRQGAEVSMDDETYYRYVRESGAAALTAVNQLIRNGGLRADEPRKQDVDAVRSVLERTRKAWRDRHAANPGGG